MRFATAFVVLALLGCETTPQRTNIKTARATDADLQKFRDMSGAWDADTTSDGESDTTVSYTVTASDSTIMEVIGEGEPWEMVTMYHLDGDTLMMTHYCSAQNQPRMVATALDGQTIVFNFLDITNLKAPTDMHIHDVMFEFIDEDHVRSSWTHFKEGEPGAPTVFTMTRRK